MTLAPSASPAAIPGLVAHDRKHRGQQLLGSAPANNRPTARPDTPSWAARRRGVLGEQLNAKASSAAAATSRPTATAQSISHLYERGQQPTVTQPSMTPHTPTVGRHTPDDIGNHLHAVSSIQ